MNIESGNRDISERYYTRQQLLEMGWTTTALRHLGPPMVNHYSGYHYDYDVHSWPLTIVARALRKAVVRAWISKRNRALAAKGKAFVTPGQYDRVQKRELARLRRAQAQYERARADVAAREKRQLARITKLRDDQILDLAGACMHAENRRAKHAKLEARRIYDLKNRYLLAILRAEVGARLHSFEHIGQERTGVVECESCGHEWFGYRLSDCFECGNVGVPVEATRATTWYIVEIGAHRFHQPERFMPADLRSLAAPTEAHDPTQPPREVPEFRLGREVLVPAALEAIIIRATTLLGTLCSRSARLASQVTRAHPARGMAQLTGAGPLPANGLRTSARTSSCAPSPARLPRQPSPSACLALPRDERRRSSPARGFPRAA